MKMTIAPILAALVLLLAMACGGSDEDVGQLVDERILEALASIPTVTPQPTATPQATSVVRTEEKPTATPDTALATTIASLIERLASAESKLVAQDQEFREFVDSLNIPSTDDIPTGDLTGSVVTKITESTEPGGCFVYRIAIGGNGNTYLVEWTIDGNIESLCFNPLSTCVQEAEIGAPLPRSCIS